MERQARREETKQTAERKSEIQGGGGGGGADSNFVFFSPSSAPRDDEGSLMCDVSVLYLLHSCFHFLCPLVVSCPPLLCLCGYLFHSFLPSVNLHQAERHKESGGVWEYKTFCFTFISKASQSRRCSP